MDCLTSSNAKPQVVGRAFVGELAATRHWIVHREMMLITEDRSQDPMGGLGLDRAMEHVLKIRRRDVHPPIRGIGRRRAGRCIRGPHCRRARAKTQQMVVLFRHTHDDFFVGAAKSQLPQGAK
jgi:hypothetical protein